MNFNVIEEAILFIENNLYNPITVFDVANAVSYSYYHFHRYFQSIMGETIGNYIRTRRLTQAAWDLIHSKKKILDIGISLYFETAEGFTRAFKDRYFMTPTQYRKNGIDVLIGNRPSPQINHHTIYFDKNIRPQIVTISKIDIIGIRFQTTIEQNKSISMWELFHKRIPNALLENKKYEIFESGENCFVDSFHLKSKASVFIGVEYPKENPLPSHMQHKQLRGGTYAKFTHKGKVQDLLDTYRYIWGVWYPKSGYELDNREDFECYTNRFVGENMQNSEIDIFFPIKHK